ncbi:hypothetical protein NEIMUCOT_04455 [Neisseria mucosa ATCC 25996]|uniref:Uncharacterized protein n=1 Tax=Neisseria mucosa (strain ATCC 25996 / DSM 4631 / NCTC 10774 / M26) TaxID=546266 RepID=D2ZV14_NEIM2|nr:hypothetical protein NEIMUCOT_04455 [Neisseria mucosa ATCC 25996]
MFCFLPFYLPLADSSLSFLQVMLNDPETLPDLIFRRPPLCFISICIL